MSCKKLLIVGNGFDVTHGISSKYLDFKKYLEELHEEKAWKLIECLENFNIKPWYDFENALGNIEYFDYLTDMDEYLKFYDDIMKYAYTIKDDGDALYDIISMWKEYFSDWIKSIDDSIKIMKYKYIKDVKSLLSQIDLVITFNYTSTIEYIYKVDKVYHIHGKPGEDIIFGHGNEEEIADFDYCIESVNSQMRNILRKDTSKQISKYKEVFDLIDTSTVEVYSYGFSFSDVDLPYIKLICSKLSIDTIWYLKTYKGENPSEIIEQKDKLIRCGFVGKIREF